MSSEGWMRRRDRGGVDSPVPPSGQSSSGPWLLLLLLQYLVWRPASVIYSSLHDLHFWGYDSLQDLPSPELAYLGVRVAATALLFLAALILARWRDRRAALIMVGGLWVVLLLFALSLWLKRAILPALGVDQVLTDRALTDHELTTGAIALRLLGAAALPMGWTAYLLEACFLGGQGRGPGETPTRLGPWLLVLICYLGIWLPFRSFSYYLQHWSPEQLLTQPSLAHARQVFLFLSLPRLILEILAAILLVLDRQRRSVIIAIIALWFIALASIALDGTHSWSWWLHEGVGAVLLSDVGTLFWPLPWTAYLLESRRVAALYPRAVPPRPAAEVF